MAKAEDYQNLYDFLNGCNLLEYGSVFPKKMVWDALKLEVPEVATMREFNQITLAELAAIDFIRNALLEQGKYIGADGDNYRVLLPSENAQQCERYMEAADRKLTRALKLSRNTPKEASSDKACQIEARILMRQEGAKDRLGGRHVLS